MYGICAEKGEKSIAAYNIVYSGLYLFNTILPRSPKLLA